MAVTNNDDDSQAAVLPKSDIESILMDAMPYLDEDYTKFKDLSDEVDALIVAELRRSTRSVESYMDTPSSLAAEKAADGLRRCSFWVTEEQRIRDEQPQTPVDMARYRVQPPTGDAALHDERAWAQAVRQAQKQLEHHTAHWLNLQLARKHGADAWRQYCEQADNVRRRLETLAARAQQDRDAINRKRKAMQTTALVSTTSGVHKLHALERAWYELVDKNSQIETQSTLLRQQIKRMRSLAEERGLVAPPPAVSSSSPSSSSSSSTAAADVVMES